MGDFLVPVKMKISVDCMMRYLHIGDEVCKIIHHNDHESGDYCIVDKFVILLDEFPNGRNPLSHTITSLLLLYQSKNKPLLGIKKR